MSHVSLFSFFLLFFSVSKKWENIFEGSSNEEKSNFLLQSIFLQHLFIAGGPQNSFIR